jgi:hypothetical protein
MKAYMNSSSSALVTLLLLFLAGELSAQNPTQTPRSERGRPSRVPVTVALVERLPYPDAPFIILRQAAEGDYILLPADATAALLTDAINALLLARQRGGDQVSADAVLRARVPDRVRGARPLPWVEHVLTDLRSAPAGAVPGGSLAPVLQIWLPRQTRPQPTPPVRRG